jgi:hypothetical protein
LVLGEGWYNYWIISIWRGSMKGITGVSLILILSLGTYIGCAEVKFSAELAKEEAEKPG